MITIYHNARCSKSRDGVCFLEETKQEFEIINYLEKSPKKREIKSLLKKLKITPIELVRKKEPVWIENFKYLELTDDQIIEAMVKFPTLIERPIIVNGNKAVIARPTEKIKDIL
ncbi:arsenate reductase (glutaredoxin) [Flavobacterium amniphilum]|uniref:arsenate reductase (glutaredoxin) n=1 Tax=Flavobacterium amniphilum TaxID=1834035 RepID=UPI00202A06F6|nr:arsenate reductase (glutaredoxin) [Flavobacterium amniphilum]MCL9804274.1 arsenate reductase (glutaredoxin) [Flavobacterium amniphilum]